MRLTGRCVFLTLVFLVLVSGVRADDLPKHPAITPEAKNLEFWQKLHQSFVHRAKEGSVDVLFLGDSITRGWAGAGKEVWAERFEPLKAANFGIGGDRTQHVLWRITEGKELEGIDPKVVVLMIGTNNIQAGEEAKKANPKHVAEGVAAIVKSLRQQRPKAKILLLAVFPRSAVSGKQLKDQAKIGPDDQQPKIKQLNHELAKLDDGQHVKFLDINSKFQEDDGSLSREVMPDYLHLSPKGYRIWADAIQEPLAELLK